MENELVPTKEKIKVRLENLLEENYGMEEIIDALAEIVKEEHDKQDHEIVKSCLNSVVEGLRQASMDYYVSTK